MSGEEIVVLCISAAATLFFAIAWLISTFQAPPLVCPIGRRWPLWLTPVACGAFLFIVLRHAAADDVTDDPKYIAMYLLLGIAWLGILQRFSVWYGLYARQDVVERRNTAAGIALSGYMLGITFSYAGGNIGNGPGWWVVLFSAALAGAALILLWMAVDAVTGLTDRVTINRDIASGLRLGAVLTAWGLILGRAVAGDWVSVEATVADFVQMSWPVVAVAAVEMLISQIARPSPDCPHGEPVLAGAIPALFYLGGSAAYVASVGSLP